MPLQFGRVLGDPDRGAGGVLVAGVRAREVAVALLAAEDEVRPPAGGFQPVHFLGHVFEADQQVADAGDVVRAGHLVDQGGGDIRLDDDSSGREPPGGAQLVDGVVGQENADFVAGQEKPLPAMVHHDADAVRIRVRAQQDVGAGLLRQRQGGAEGFHHLRIGDVEGHPFEGPARVGGLRAQVQLEPQPLQHRIDRGDAGAVQRGIKNLQPALRRKRHGGDGRVVGAVDLRAHDRDPPAAAGLIEPQALDRAHVAGDLVHEDLVVRRDELAAVLVIDFLAVVRRQVVAGAEHVAGDGLQMTDGEREFRRAAHAVEEMDLDAVGGVDLGRGPGQLPAVEVPDGVGDLVGVDPLLAVGADVEGHDDPAALGLRAVNFQEVLRMPLGRCLNGPGVDAVRPDADRSPAAAGAERDHLVEGVQQQLPFAGLDQEADLRNVLGEGGVGQPGLQVMEGGGLYLVGNIQPRKSVLGCQQQVHSGFSVG